MYRITNRKLGRNLHWYKNKNVLWAKYNTRSVKIEEEYVLMNLNAIIAAAGGSLGLFLGLSGYGLVWMLVEMMESTYNSIPPVTV